MFKSIKWSHKFLTVRAALPLSDLKVEVENVISVSGKVYLIRVSSYRRLPRISLDVELVASFVPVWTITCFGFLGRIGCT